MSALRPIEIIGGGLAGLSLGLALRRAGVPVTIFEAGNYPRHRVCGEFIAGLPAGTIEKLGLTALLADAKPRQSVSWFRREQLVRRQKLQRPALAISRRELDARLADAFQQSGGKLVCGQRIDISATAEGRVYANGRRRAPSEWIGLKLHARGLPLRDELEFHLGDSAYVGLCAVKEGAVNVCGLFRQRPGLQVSRSTAIVQYLEASGLTALAERIGSVETIDESISAVAGFTFSRPEPTPGRVDLGDAYAMIPPFTGNGMSIAFQSAECALDPLTAWSRGQENWGGAASRTMSTIRRRFDRRLALADRLHPFLFSPRLQPLFDLANRSGLLPLRALTLALHT